MHDQAKGHMSALTVFTICTDSLMYVIYLSSFSQMIASAAALLKDDVISAEHVG